MTQRSRRRPGRRRRPSSAGARELPPWAEKAFIPVFFVVVALLPFASTPAAT